MLSHIHKTIQPTLLSLLLALFISGCGHNYTSEEHIAKAKEFIGKQDFKSASIELTNAVTKKPTLAEGRWLRAQVLLVMGDFATAEKEANKAVELGISKFQAQPLLANIVLQLGDFDRVIKITETITGMPTAKEKALILALRGQAFVLKGQTEIADQTFAQALQIDPNSTTSLIGRTALHAFKKEYIEAQLWADKAIKSDARSADAWSAKGDIELAQGHLASAEEAFSNAIKYRHFLMNDSAKRAFIRILLDKPGEAQSDLDLLSRQGNQNNPYVNYVAGRLYFKLKKYNKAAEAFEASLAVEGTSVLSRLFLAAVYYESGQLEKALANAQIVYRAIPGSLRVHKLIAAIYIRQSNNNAASAILNQALALAPNDVDVINLLADLSLAQGNRGKGLDYATKAAKLAPESAIGKSRLMIHQLLAGKSVNEDFLSTTSIPGDTFQKDFILALAAVRDKQFDAALEQAIKLQAQYPGKSEPDNLIASIYMLTGQLSKAKIELEKVLKKKENDPSATRALAMIESQSGNPKRSQERLLSYLKSNTSDTLAVLQLADVASRLNNVAIAIPFLEQTLQNNPNSLAIRARLAVENLNTRHPQKVLTLTQGLSDEQLASMPYLLELRGKALMLTGDIPSAQKTFERWKQLAPNSPSAHFYHGESAVRAGNIAAARKDLDQALKLNPHYLPARIAEIKLLAQSRQIDKAQQALNKLKQEFPGRPEALGIEGWFYLGIGKFADAERALSAVLKAAPDSEVAILLARAQWGQKHYEESIKGMQAWLKQQPKDLSMLMHQAGAYLSLGKDEDARGVYAQIVQYYPGHVVALNNLAWLSKDKDLNMAIKYAQEARALSPKDPLITDTLAMLFLKRNDVTSAERLLQDAAQLSPGVPIIQLHLGQVLVRLQKHGQARKILEGLMKKAPNSTEAKEAKALLTTFDTNAQ